MKDREVTLEEQVDARLTINAMRKHAQLWRIVEGRARWTETIGFVVSVLLIGFGVVRLAQDHGLSGLFGESEIPGLGYFLIGALMLVSFVAMHGQRQFSALVEIVKRLEQDREGR